MSVRLKVFLCLAGVAVLLWLACAFLATRIFLENFKGLDEQRISRSVDRVGDYISDREQTIATATKLWAASGGPASAESADKFLTTTGLNIAAVVDASGKVSNVYWSKAPTAPDSPLTQGDAANISRLISMAHADGKVVSGLLSTTYGPMIFAAIGFPEGSPNAGSGFLCGQFLGKSYVEQINDQLLINASLLPPTEENLRALKDGGSIVVPPPGEGASEIAGYTLLKDAFGNPATVLKVTEIRQVYIAGTNSVQFFLGITAGSGILVVIVGTLLVEALVTGRIRKLIRSARHADQNGMDDLPRKFTRGADEISSLARVTKSMVDRLRASQLLYRAVIETQADLIVRFKYDGEITFANQAISRFLGRHQKNLVGRNISEFFSQAAIGVNFLEEAKSAISQAHPKPLDLQYTKQPSAGDEPPSEAPGQQWLEWNLRALKAEDGAENEIQAVGHDITMSREYAAGLEVAKEAAESANKAKTEFMTIMGHETRTPLTSIMGFASILEKTPLSTEQKEYVDLIRASGHSLLTLLNDLNDYSNLDGGKVDIKLSPIRIRDLVKEVIASNSPEARAKGLELEAEIDLDAPEYIEGDAIRLRQILNNLVDNGIKFTSRGFVRLGVRGIGNDMARFTVQDTGVGISEEGLSRLFQPFSRLEPSATKGYGGAGLGLAICQRHVERLGSKIEVESAPGLGSLFRFDIKIGNPAVASSGGGEFTESNQPSDEGMPLVPPSILIVEDNAINRKVASRMIELLGFPCETASSGRLCLEMTAQKHYDIIFMDIQMPEMDGFETVKHLRGREAVGKARSYVVACTAFNLPGDRERCLEAGMDSYISKPLQASAIKDAFRDYVKKVHAPTAKESAGAGGAKWPSYEFRSASI